MGEETESDYGGSTVPDSYHGNRSGRIVDGGSDDEGSDLDGFIVDDDDPAFIEELRRAGELCDQEDRNEEENDLAVIDDEYPLKDGIPTLRRENARRVNLVIPDSEDEAEDEREPHSTQRIGADDRGSSLKEQGGAERLHSFLDELQYKVDEMKDYVGTIRSTEIWKRGSGGCCCECHFGSGAHVSPEEEEVNNAVNAMAMLRSQSSC
jgi:hypothetical protein